MGFVAQGLASISSAGWIGPRACPVTALATLAA
jgi:hypothetical protein